MCQMSDRYLGLGDNVVCLTGIGSLSNGDSSEDDVRGEVSIVGIVVERLFPI